MPNKNIEVDLRERVDAFVSDIAELIRRSALEIVRQALGGTSPQAPARSTAARSRATPRSAPPARRPGPRSKTGRIRRSPEELEELGGTFLEHVRAHPGQRLEQISAALGVSTKDLKRPVQQLSDQKAIRTEGQKRGTRYFAGAGGRKGKSKAKAKSKSKSAKKRTSRKSASPRSTSRKNAA